METISLEVSTRDKSVKPKQLLGESLLPIEFYGHGVENRSLQVDYQSFRRAFRAAGNNTVMEITVDGKDKLNVLVHRVDYNPVRDTFTHVDFINVRMNEEVHTNIPLEFVGMSTAVKDLGGTLMMHLNEVEVKCLPKDLVHTIEVSIDLLVDFQTFVRVKDLVVPNGITVLNEEEDVVVTAVPPRVEEEAVVGDMEAAEAKAVAAATGGDEKKEEGSE